MQNEFQFTRAENGKSRTVKPYYLKMEYDDFDLQGTDLGKDINGMPFHLNYEYGHRLTIVKHPVNFITEIFVYLGPLEQSTHYAMMKEEWECCDVQKLD